MGPRPHQPDSMAEALRSAHAGDPDAAALVALFAAELPSRVRALHAMLAEGRLNELRECARRLSLSSGASGFGPVAMRAAALGDTLDADSDLADIAAALDDLAAMCRRVIP